MYKPSLKRLGLCVKCINRIHRSAELINPFFIHNRTHEMFKLGTCSTLRKTWAAFEFYGSNITCKSLNVPVYTHTITHTRILRYADRAAGDQTLIRWPAPSPQSQPQYWTKRQQSEAFCIFAWRSLNEKMWVYSVVKLRAYTASLLPAF